MLKAEEIEAIGDKASQLLEPLTEYLLKDLAQRVARAGQLTSTAQYETWKLQQLGLSQKEIRQKLKKILKTSEKTMDKLLTQSAEVGYNFDLKSLPTQDKIPFAENSVIQDIVSAAVKLADEELENITQTIGMVDPYGNVQPLRQSYVKCMDYAFMRVSTGATDYMTAVREATKNLADMGIKRIDYESGVHTSIEAATRRCVMGGLGLMQEQISAQTHDMLGADGWEIDAHYCSAPDHEPIQGKQYSDEAYTALNNSLKRRIGTLNCGHSAFPIILGVDSPQYSREELEKMRQENEKGITYNGKHYSGYEATQKQRSLETAIRRQRKRILVDEAAGDNEKLKTDRMKLTALNQEYKRFTEAAGFKLQRERMEVVNYNWKQENALETMPEGGSGQNPSKEESKHMYDSTVISPTVNTAAYRKLYNNLPESTEIQRTVYKAAKDMLNHRSGTKFEDMAFINSQTGESVTRTDYDKENQVEPSRRMKAMVQGAAPKTIIAVHNHPGSSVPSIVDLEGTWERKYKYGVIACHNGTVILYDVTKKINSVIISGLLDEATSALYNENKEELTVILKHLKAEGIEMEVYQ